MNPEMQVKCLEAEKQKLKEQLDLQHKKMEGSQLEISGCPGQPRSEGNQEPRIKGFK